MEENKKAVKRFEEKFGKKDREDFSGGGGAGLACCYRRATGFYGGPKHLKERRKLLFKNLFTKKTRSISVYVEHRSSTYFSNHNLMFQQRVVSRVTRIFKKSRSTRVRCWV